MSKKYWFIVFALLIAINFTLGAPQLTFNEPTPANGTSTTNTSIQINTSISASQLQSLIYNWNGTNFSFFDNSLKCMFNFNNISSLGESDSLIVDLSDGIDNATPVSATWTSDGKYGGAYTFNTTNSLSLTSQSYLKPPLYLSFWMKSAPENATGWLFIKYGGAGYSWDGWGILTTSDNKIGIWLNGNAQDNYFYSTESFNQEWNHVYAEVRTSGQNKIYLNGGLVLTGTDSNTVYNENVALGIGNGFNGSIDELRIWNRSLSNQEIYQDYASNLKKIDPTNWQLYVNQSKNVTSGLDNGTYTYQLFVSNSSGTEYSELRIINILNETGINETPVINSSINLDWVYPLQNINVKQNEFFNVSVNVTCAIQDCGEINVTLDPISGGGKNYTVYNSSESGGDAFEWENTSLEGGSIVWQNVNYDDSGATLVNMPFNFSFYGTNYSSSYIVPNGRIHFTSSSVGSITLSLPTNSIPLIAPVHNDMYVVSGKTVVSTRNATSPNRFIIEYKNLSYYSYRTTYITYQVILYEDGRIKIQYSPDSMDYYNSAKIGINFNSTDYLFFDSTDAPDQYRGLALTFYPPDWAGGIKSGTVSTIVGDTPFYTTTQNPYNITLNAGQSQVITWQVNATGTSSNTTNHEFFVYANMTSDLSVNNITSKWNITIVNYTIDYSAPVITLNTPLDNSGNEENITFEYSVNDSNNITNCSLIFNDAINQTNNTISKDVAQEFMLYNLGIGNCNWAISCYDEFNNLGTSETRNLGVVKKSKFIGNTTDLSLINIQNITNLIIDYPNQGHINFSQTINLSSGADIDSYVNISFNRIEINSSALPELNKSARLTLYNLVFTDPRILRDEEVCSDCVEESYEGGTLIFNVTGFSVYSAEETPITTETPATSGGSGSGGGSSTIKKECTLDSECKRGYSCFNNKCVKLFDVEILEIIPEIENLAFNLKYLIKGMAEIKGDVIIKFWIQSRNPETGEIEKIELGQDAIYLGSFEEKVKTTTLNLPKNIKNRDYDLYTQVNFENYKAESFRKININLPRGITFADESKFSLRDFIYRIFLVIAVLIILLIITIAIIKSSKSLSKQRESKIYKKLLERIEKMEERVKNFFEFKLGRLKKPKRINGAVSLTSLINKSVFSTTGNKIGIVEQPIITGNRIYGWVVKMDKNSDFKERKFLIKQEHLQATGDIFLVDNQVAELLIKDELKE